MAYDVPINSKAVDDLIDKLNKAGDAADALNGKMRGVGRVGSGGGGIAGGGVGPSPANDPFAKAARMNQDYDGLSGASLKSALLNNSKAMAAATRAGNAISGFDQKKAAAAAYATSRVGPDGKLYPLVNKLASAGLGMPGGGQAAQALASAAPAVATAMAEALGPLMAPIMAVVGAAVGAHYVGSTVGKAAGAFYTTGGTGREIGQMMGLGGPDAAGKAMSLSGSLRSNTYGAAYMWSHGVRDFGSITVDKAANYVKSMDILAHEKSDKKAVRIARDLGMSDDLWTRDLYRSNRGLYNELKNSSGEMGTARERNLSANFRGHEQLAGNQWDKFVRRTGNVVLPLANFFLQNANWEIDQLGHIWNGIGQIGGGSGSGPKRTKGGGSPSDYNGFVRPRNLDDGGAQWSGGGGRSRGAIPAGWRGQQLDSINDSDANRLGAFNVG